MSYNKIFLFSGSAFPVVAAAVETELEEYKSAENKLKGLKSNMSDPESVDLLSDSTAKLTSAITSLPEILKKKANIDKHMSIAMGKYKLFLFKNN